MKRVEQPHAVQPHRRALRRPAADEGNRHPVRGRRCRRRQYRRPKYVRLEDHRLRTHQFGVHHVYAGPDGKRIAHAPAGHLDSLQLDRRVHEQNPKAVCGELSGSVLHLPRRVAERLHPHQRRFGSHDIRDHEGAVQVRHGFADGTGAPRVDRYQSVRHRLQTRAIAHHAPDDRLRRRVRGEEYDGRNDPCQCE